jgi:hypothetical protein
MLSDEDAELLNLSKSEALDLEGALHEAGSALVMRLGEDDESDERIDRAVEWVARLLNECRAVQWKRSQTVH